MSKNLISDSSVLTLENKVLYSYLHRHFFGFKSELEKILKVISVKLDDPSLKLDDPSYKQGSLQFEEKYFKKLVDQFKKIPAEKIKTQSLAFQKAWKLCNTKDNPDEFRKVTNIQVNPWLDALRKTFCCCFFSDFETRSSKQYTREQGNQNDAMNELLL